MTSGKGEQFKFALSMQLVQTDPILLIDGKTSNIKVLSPPGIVIGKPG